MNEHLNAQERKWKSFKKGFKKKIEHIRWAKVN